MLRVGVIGATGYTGEELVRIIVGHGGVELTSLSALIERPTRIDKIVPGLKGRCGLVCGPLDMKALLRQADLLFLALPHTVSMRYAPQLLKAGKMVIDLSADYRLPASVYKRWYGKAHTDVAHLREAVYGLPEFFREAVRMTHFVANPGCYPTSILLAAAPLIKKGIVKPDGIIADSKSGVTGAGRKASLQLIFGEAHESFRAYKIGNHQHAPEITQGLSRLRGKKVDVLFVPHLAPMNRGILSTVYMDLKRKMSQKAVMRIYKDFYMNDFFVNVLDRNALPDVKDVTHTNMCEIGVRVERGKVVAVSAIDNLLKGAAGQAVQNMNIMCGFDEAKGLV